MYLAYMKGIGYWLYSDTKASGYCSDTAEEAFIKLDNDYFIPSVVEVYYKRNGNVLHGYTGSEEIPTQHPPSQILAEIPVDCTYEEFALQYPELLI